jgi:hypothetical protein
MIKTLHSLNSKKLHLPDKNYASESLRFPLMCLRRHSALLELSLGQVALFCICASIHNINDFHFRATICFLNLLLLLGAEILTRSFLHPTIFQDSLQTLCYSYCAFPTFHKKDHKTSFILGASSYMFQY